MKKLSLILLVLILSISTFGQSEKQGLIKNSLTIKTTGIRVKDFKIKKALTAYDIALNCTYMHFVSEDINSDYLVLPVLAINKLPISAKELKKIKAEDVIEYQFSTGIETRALYGTSAYYGRLVFKLKEEKKR
ncbi:hypothetical protein [Labilibacter marinus]|uniref:hypothetical protein n=1 Tax=Labilibacter marinus TaxID=1477105 RepID=UPI00117B9318|nr:hypothetical protein [Labilibacter marinus]